jgi:hypothetical protein
VDVEDVILSFCSFSGSTGRCAACCLVILDWVCNAHDAGGVWLECFMYKMSNRSRDFQLAVSGKSVISLGSRMELAEQAPKHLAVNAYQTSHLLRMSVA